VTTYFFGERGTLLWVVGPHSIENTVWINQAPLLEKPSSGHISHPPHQPPSKPMNLLFRIFHHVSQPAIHGQKTYYFSNEMLESRLFKFSGNLQLAFKHLGRKPPPLDGVK
jgi:hypothetical protein